MDLEKFIKNGVVFVDPNTTYIDDSVTIGSGTVVGPMVVISGNSVVGEDCFIGALSNISNSVLDDRARVFASHIDRSHVGFASEVGPNAHLRPNSFVGAKCKVGNFVELKACKIGDGSKVAHLTYVGDAVIGKNCNIGCGVIFVNYDGINKHQTIVGDNCFVGSNCNLIAPLSLADNVFVAAGTTVTRDVAQNDFCVGRVRQEIKTCVNNKYLDNLAKKGLYQQPKLFGTDGIRGVYDDGMSDELANRIGQSLCKVMPQAKIVVGRDTRESGPSLASALAQGVVFAGGSVVDLGIVSTPAVSFMTRLKKADFGVALTASHNPTEFNGIKIFDETGSKIADNLEKNIEQRVGAIKSESLTSPLATRLCDSSPYLNKLVSLGIDLSGLKIVLDVGSGAASEIAEKAFLALGAEAVVINKYCGDSKKINNGQGALFPEVTQQAVLRYNADMGFSFDGDADRIVAVGSNGEIFDGDAIMFGIAKNYVKHQMLEPKIVVATKQSNLALVRELNKLGVSVSMVAVGDKYVAREMKALGSMLGGEQSGHIIHGNISPSGDGVLTAIILAKMCKTENIKLEELCHFVPNPQRQKSYVVSDKKAVIESKNVKNLVSSINNRLFPSGRAFLRASGTEQKIRLLVEAENKNDCDDCFLQLDTAIKNYIEREKS